MRVQQPRREQATSAADRQLPGRDPRAADTTRPAAAADAADGATIDLIDPSTGEVFATSPRSGAADVDDQLQVIAFNCSATSIAGTSTHIVYSSHMWPK